MNTEQNERLKQLLAEAHERAPNERAAFLTQACAGDDELRREVESLLAFDETSTGFLDHTAWKQVAEEMVAGDATALLDQTIGHYRIQSLLGAGGMGQVFLALDTKLGRQVAIKFLPLPFTSDAERVRRFAQEARAASALNHPNIITMHEIGVHEGWHYLVMEHVAGQTLRTCLQAGKLKSEEAVDIAAQIADALAAAHHAGIVHRDIKPENIMLTASGLVKVLDFGIAKLGEELEEKGRKGEGEKGRNGDATTGFADSPTLPHSLSPLLPFSATRPLSTALGTVLGTVNYMSPEQARGEALNGQSDVFSLGQMLLEMVTGKHLFAGKEAKDVLQLLRSEQERLAADHKLEGVPKALEPVIRKALKRNLAERYETAQQMLGDLNKLQRRTATKGLRWGVAGGLLGMVLLLVALGFSAWYSTIESWEPTILRDGHTQRVNSVAFSPDGRFLVSASDDTMVMVWDFAQRRRLKTLTDHTANVNAVAFSSDGKLFATGSHDKTIIVWDATTFAKITTLSDPRDAVRSVAFSPEGKWLAAITSAAKEDGTGRSTALWNTNRWVKEREIPSGADYGTILFSPDSHLLVTNQVRWELVSDRKILNDKLPDDQKFGNWNWAAISPDAKTLVSINPIGGVIFRELTQANDLTNSRLLHQARPHQDHGRAVAFSPDGKLVATGTDDILLWDTETRRIVSRFDDVSLVWSLTFSRDGRSLVSAHGDGSIQVRDVNDRRRTVGFDGHGNHVLVVTTSPDGKTIASAGKDGAVILWNAETEQKETVLFGHETRVINLAFSPDGTWLASFDQDGYLIRWDVATHLQQWKIPACRGTACLAISPDGKWIANTCRIYESSQGKEIGMWEEKQMGLNTADSAAFSPDGKSFALVGGRKIVLLDTQNRQVIVQQEATSNLTRVSFSPDGQSIVTGSGDGTLVWWDAATLTKHDEVKAHQRAISAVRFAPDGKTLATADAEAVVTWDAARRKQLTSNSTQGVPVYALAFAQAGKQLLAAQRDRDIRLFTHHRKRWGTRLD